MGWYENLLTMFVVVYNLRVPTSSEQNELQTLDNIANIL